MAILIGLSYLAWVAVILTGTMTLFFLAFYWFIFAKCYIKTPSDHMIVRTGFGGTATYTNGTFVIPTLHHHEIVPIFVQTLRYERTADSPLRFSCGTTATLIAEMMLRINNTTEDAERAISQLGLARIKDTEALRELFGSAFNCTLETIALQSSFAEVTDDKDAFREKMLRNLGTDMKGMVLDDLCIHHVTPIE